MMKKFDSFTIFLIFTIFFTALFSLYTNETYKKEKSYRVMHDYMYKLASLDDKFDTFLTSQKKIMDFDSINYRLKKFDVILEKIQDNKLYINNKTFMENDLSQIKRTYIKKRVLIERFKSYNATTMYSLSYLIDLSRSIKRYQTTTYKNADTYLDGSIYELFKIYLNFQIENSGINKDLAWISAQKNKTTELTLFHENLKSALNRISKINGIKKEALALPLKQKILKLHKRLNKIHNATVAKEKNITAFMFIFTTLLLIILIMTYRKFLKIQTNLKSFRYAVENSDDSVVITDKDRHITYVNEAFSKNTGYSFDEAMGKNPNILKSGKLPQKFYNDMNAILNRGEKWSGDFINRDKNGQIYYEKASITPMFTKNKLSGYLAIKLNISEYIKEQEKVKYLAYHDNLTKLPNRRKMKLVLSQQINLENDLALFFLDLDGFKDINDTLGHDVGDTLLREISKRIYKYLNKEDTFFRTGGDEFAILLNDIKDRKDIAKIAKEIIELTNKPIHAQSHILRVGISIGVALYGKEDIISFLKHADIAMYNAKESGKNIYKFYTKKLSEVINKKVAVEKELKTAIQNGEFHMVYQPKYNLKTKEFKSMEALIRWQNKNLGLVPPDYFIPIAEGMSVIQDIGIFTFRRACEDFIEIQKYSNNIKKVSINLSPAQLKNKNIAKEFFNITQEMGIKTSSIGLEITETHLMKNIKENSKIVTQMREYGFNIIIDDFGTGYSSMSYLKKLPITNLKIDKSFVDDICTDKSDVEIVKATIAICKSFNYDIVAEGIETKEQEELLANLGVRFGQGYLFSKPKTKAELIEFIKSRRDT